MRYSIYPMLVLMLAVFTSLNSTSLNAGAIHKWVDEKGNVHYSDAPPAKAKSENVRVQSAPTNPGKALPRLNPTEASDEASDQAASGASNEQKMSDEQASSICELARQDLEIINTSNRIRLKQADGKGRYLDNDEIQQRRTSSQAEIDQFCN